MSEDNKNVENFNTDNENFISSKRNSLKEIDLGEDEMNLRQDSLSSSLTRYMMYLDTEDCSISPEEKLCEKLEELC